MIVGDIQIPRNKNELIHSLQKLRQPKIDVINVIDKSERSKLIQALDKMLSKGVFTVIFLKD